MSYSKEQFIEDFKNAYNQSQQLHFLYKYLREYEGQIASVDVKKLDEETESIAYYQFIFTLDNGNVIETNSIEFASYTFVNELDTKVTSINNTITSLERRISNNEEDIVEASNRIGHNEDGILDINGKMLKLPDTAPTTRKVVTINTNGAQDNVDGTELTTLMGNIVDSHGNKRFVEGDIIMETISGVNKIYGKWSLSGTHLMIRLVLNLANNTTLAASSKICTINLPQWMINKIIPIFDTYINISTFGTVGGGSDTTIKLSLRKFNTNTLAIYTSAGQYVSMRDERLEIQFDLLIDSE